MSIISILAEDNELIPYRKSLREIAGSITSTILLQQMIHRFVHHNYEPFYKFKEPCKNEFYREGDSWVEEIGFSAEEFDTALKYISTKIKIGDEKNIFPDNDASMAMKAKCMITCWMDVHRRTWYSVNVELLESLLALVYVNRQPRFSPKNQKPKPATPVYPNRQPRFTQTDNPGSTLYTTESTTESPAEKNRSSSSLVEVPARVENPAPVVDDDLPTTAPPIPIVYDEQTMPDHLTLFDENDLRATAYERGNGLWGSKWPAYGDYTKKVEFKLLIMLLEWIAYYADLSQEDYDKINNLPAVIRAHLNKNEHADLLRSQRYELFIWVMRQQTLRTKIPI